MRLHIFCLFFCYTASAQVDLSSGDSSVVALLDLPSSEPFDTARAYQRVNKSFLYFTSENDLYRIFGYDTYMKFYQFNFTDYHIRGKLGANKKWKWEKRENKKAFTEIPVQVSIGYTGPGLSPDKRYYFRDSVVRANSDTAYSRWYTTGMGDCKASFDYKIYADKYYPVILLKEWNYWGGCRAGGSRAYTLTFLMPSGILYSVKNTILADKRGDGGRD